MSARDPRLLQIAEKYMTARFKPDMYDMRFYKLVNVSEDRDHWKLYFGRTSQEMKGDFDIEIDRTTCGVSDFVPDK